MTDHEHVWSPLEGEFRRYACGCGVTGYRTRSGVIVPHKDQPARYKQPTATAKPFGVPNLPGGNKRMGRFGGRR